MLVSIFKKNGIKQKCGNHRTEKTIYLLFMVITVWHLNLPECIKKMHSMNGHSGNRHWFKGLCVHFIFFDNILN